MSSEPEPVAPRTPEAPTHDGPLLDGGPLRFPPGQFLSTPGALAALQAAHVGVWDLLRRHLTGDWGDVDAEDWQANEQALRYGTRLLSAYPLATGQRLWVITEADRSATTLLLPEEY